MVAASSALALAAAGAAQAGDLVTSGVVLAPRFAHPGGPLRAQSTVKAVGAVGASATRYYLSTDRVRNAADLRLSPATSVPALTAGRTFTAPTELRLPATARIGLFYLLACADDLKTVPEPNEANNCAASAMRVRVTVDPLTTVELVAAAIKRGEITSQQGLVYRVFNSFGIPRIPVIYRGDDGPVQGDDAPSQAMDRWSTLSTTTRATLGPYFEPPAAKGGWGDPTTSARSRTGAAVDCYADRLHASEKWTSFLSSDGHVRVWYVKDNPAVATMAIALAREIPHIWKTFADLMGRTPLSDAGAPCYHGPDGRLDVYFTPNGGAGTSDVGFTTEDYLRWGFQSNVALTLPYPPRCSATPAFIVVRTSSKTEQVRPVGKWIFAHELFHAFQSPYPYKEDLCEAYKWFDEASATWAAHYAYPSNHVEHAFWGWNGLFSDVRGLATLDYESWPAVLWLEKVYGPQTIPAVYAAFANKYSVAAINLVLPGGLRRAWPKLALTGWNAAPVSPSFRTWDEWPERPSVVYPHPRELSLNGQKERTVNVCFAAGSWAGLDRCSDFRPSPIQECLCMKPVSRGYHWLKLSESRIRELEFTNTLTSQPDAAVQAILKFADGHLEIKNWTSYRTRTFCRDSPAQDVTDIVIVYSWSQYADLNTSFTPPQEPRLTLRDSCRYKITGGSWSTTATLTEAADFCAQSGIPSGGTATTSGTTGGVTQPWPPVSKLERDTVDGVQYVSGQISAKTTWKYDVTRNGCKFLLPSGELVPCTRNDHTTAPPAAFDVFSVDFQPRKATLTGHWSVPSPEVGFSSGDDGGDNPSCMVANDSFVWEDDETKQSVPLTKFTSDGSQTLSFTGSKTFSRTEPAGGTTTMTYHWDFTITFERV